MVQWFCNADRIYTFFISQLDSFPTSPGPLHPSLIFFSQGSNPEQATFFHY